MDVQKTALINIDRDERRFENSRADIQKRHEEALKEIEDNSSEETEKLRAFHQKRLAELDEAYKVDISRQSDRYRELIDQNQREQETSLQEIKTKKDEEFKRLEQREEKKIEAYRRNQEQVLADMHAQYQKAEKSLKDYYED